MDLQDSYFRIDKFSASSDLGSVTINGEIIPQAGAEGVEISSKIDVENLVPAFWRTENDDPDLVPTLSGTAHINGRGMSMPTSWIALYPWWYAEEMGMLTEHYPELRVCEPALAAGKLWCFGDIKVMPSKGAVRYPVWLLYPQGTPFSPPVVMPLTSLPEFDGDGLLKTALVPRR